MATYPLTKGTLGVNTDGGYCYPTDGSVSYSPRTGRKLKNKVKVQRENVPGWESWLLGQGAEYEIDPIGNTTFFWVTWWTAERNDALLLATGNSNVELTTTWAMDTIELSKDIWEHPLIVAQMRKFTTSGSGTFFETGLTKRRTIRLLIEALLKGITSIPDPDGSEGDIKVSVESINQYLTGNGQDDTAGKFAWTLFIDALSYGVSNFNVSSWSLKRRMVLPANSPIKANLDNVNRIFTSGGVLADLALTVALPVDDVKFRMPDGGYWVKKSASSAQNSTGYWEINEEWWWLEEYLPFVNGVAI